MRASSALASTAGYGGRWRRPGRSSSPGPASPASLPRLAADDGLAGGYPQLYVVELAGGGGHVRLAPRTPYWPGLDVVAVAVDEAGRAGGGPHVTSPRARRIPPAGTVESLRVLAWSVPASDDDRSATVVVGVATLAAADRSHSRLASFMWWSGGALLAVGVGLAVGLARGRFWLVDRRWARRTPGRPRR